jgi:hypothetical protein
MKLYWFKAFYTDRDGWTIEFKYSVFATNSKSAEFKCKDVERHFEEGNSWLSYFTKELYREFVGVEEL